MNTLSMSMSAARPRPSTGRERGFTLIELMITVAIIAILATIAIPSYQDSIWKGKRAEAKAAIFKALQSEERYYSQSNTYVAYSTSALPPSGAFPVFSADTQANSRYTLEAKALGASPLCTDNDIKKCVVIIATVVGSADPKCGATLSMDSIGNKTSAVSNAACWK